MKAREKLGVGKIPLLSILVAVQVILEDLSILVDWSQKIRLFLLLAGFTLDLVASLLFLLRLYGSLAPQSRSRSRVFPGSLQPGRLLANFLSSVPVLVLWSGPTLLGLLATTPGTAVTAGLLPLYRVGRHLRLLRLLGRISGGLGLSAAVLAVGAITLLGAFTPSPEAGFEEVVVFASALEPGALPAFARTAQDLIQVKREGQVLYQGFGERRFHRDFGPYDFVSLRVWGMDCLFSTKAYNRAQSRENLAAILVFLALIPFLGEKSKKKG